MPIVHRKSGDPAMTARTLAQIADRLGSLDAPLAFQDPETLRLRFIRGADLRSYDIEGLGSVDFIDLDMLSERRWELV
jgi:hypothetical protein